MKLLMLKGLPGSGKSTHARKLADTGWVRVNKDDLRAMLHNGVWSRKNEKQILSVRDHIIREALGAGKSVVVDDTNFAAVHRDTLSQIAKEFGAKFITEFFDVTPEECIKRDLARPNSVGSKVIMDMYNRYLKPPAETYVPPVTGKPAVIVDIDGTLALKGDRNPYDWERVSEDAVNRPVADLVNQLYDTHAIIVVSGRDEVCRKDTLLWLADNEIFFDDLRMRPKDDMRKDSIVKREIFDLFIRDKYDVRFVLDDRNSVVAEWRQIGLPCFQVADGDF